MKNINYSDLTESQLLIINEYCKDDMKKLKKICYLVWGNKGLPTCYYDDLYDDAMNVLVESVITYNPNNNTKFKTYLMNNIKLSQQEWYRDTHLRAKRNNLELDKNGKIKKDENGNPIIIKNISFDAPAEDGIDLKEKVSSRFVLENESQIGLEKDENVEIFLDSLSNRQRRIIELKMDDYTSDEIKKILNLTDREYNSAMKSIQINENLSLFTKNINDCNYKEETEMERIMEINEADNYRMDKRSMFSLLEDKKSGDINCKYILQRKPFQWTQEERNRYICRILSNLPIPEIILCEQNVKGMMIAHLIDGLQRLSYAEAFKENRFKIGTNGAERHLIQYRDFILDEDGQRVLDEDGIPTFEIKVCDVVGKFYKDLPDELKKRFNNFNVNVTKFFNCTDEQIADHIRDYNNHASMNNEQLGMTKISADTARKIKAIAEKNTFFKNCGKFTDATSTKGKIDKIVSESIMLLFHRDEWKSKIDKAYQYIDKNATDEEFLGLNSDLNRLELVLGEENKEIKEMFTVASTPMWLAVFHEFTTYNMEDSRFIDFMSAYKNELCQKEIDGVSMSDFKDMQSKKKATITGKIDLLVKLMREFLHIDSVDLEEVNTLDFVRKNVKSDTTEEDVEFYSDMLDDITLEVDNDTKLLDKHNRPSLIALVGYACENEYDDVFTEWIKRWFSMNNSYILNQKNNFLHMKQDFDNYLEGLEVV